MLKIRVTDVCNRCKVNGGKIIWSRLITRDVVLVSPSRSQNGLNTHQLISRFRLHKKMTTCLSPEAEVSISSPPRLFIGRNAVFVTSYFL